MPELVPNHMFDRFMMSAKRYEEKWRKSNQKCFEYVDDEQWTSLERAAIEERGQQPTVINTIQPTIEMVCAVAKEKQADVHVTGREGSDDKKATLMTELLRHVFDVCDFEYYHDEAVRESLIGGRSWFECSKYTDERGKDLIKVEKLPWENVYLDPFSRKPDASDARFIIKVKWVDRDLAKKFFPDAAEYIDCTFDEDYQGQEYEAQMHGGAERGDAFYYDSRSNRVRICECYYSMPATEEIKYLDELTGQEKTKSVTRLKIHYVIFTDNIILKGSATDHTKNKNPLEIDMYPIVPMYCMRDREGRPRGIVKGLIDIQDQINKLNSKFLWALATNRLIAEEGALKDPDEAKEEFQRPDGLIILTEGGLNRVRIDDKYRDLSYMSNHLNFLLATEQRISGVNDSMLGIGGTNERSGTMQSARIAQGAAMQTRIMDNMFFSKKRIAQIVLRMIGKYYTDYRVLRITQPNGTVASYEFNKAEYTVDPATGKKVVSGILNQIEDTLFYDVILKRNAPFNSVRERQLQIFSEVLKSGVIPPQIAAKMMLMLSDMPHKEDLLFELENYYKQQEQMAQQQAQAEMAAVQQAQGGSMPPMI